MKTTDIIFIWFTCMVVAFAVTINNAEAKEWRAGVSISVPLNFQEMGDRGTFTVHGEVYDADRVTIHHNETTNNIRNRTTTNNNQSTTSLNVTTVESYNFDVNGIGNDVDIH